MTRIKKQKLVKNIQRKNTQKLTLSNKPVRGLLFAPYEELKKNNICVISWDRITIAGTLFAELNRSTLLELGWHETKLINGYAQQFRLMRGRKQVAELIRNKHNGRNYWRLDTSNHLTEKEKEKLTKTAQLMQDNIHITRLDLAIDFINCKHSGMKHNIYKQGTSQALFLDRYGTLETLYAGKQSSNIRYCYYNKLKERQKAKDNNIPIPYKTWERIELRLKGQKVNEWITQATKMLKYFKMPTIENNQQLKGSTKIILASLIEHPERINELASKRTRAKYRKLMKQYKGFNTDWQEMALDELNKRIPELNKELLDFDSRLITQLFSID